VLPSSDLRQGGYSFASSRASGSDPPTDCGLRGAACSAAGSLRGWAAGRAYATLAGVERAGPSGVGGTYHCAKKAGHKCGCPERAFAARRRHCLYYSIGVGIDLDGGASASTASSSPGSGSQPQHACSSA
jgi:hypothetical protein